jgi:hypothetical protein
MNEILLDMSRKPQLLGHLFISKARFMTYMSNVYLKEERDISEANRSSFKIMKRRPKSEVKEIVALKQQEVYLNQVENMAIHRRCDYSQFRAKIAAVFPINKGYDLLVSMISAQKGKSKMEIVMTKSFNFTKHDEQLLLAQANAVGGYYGVDELKICYKK